MPSRQSVPLPWSTVWADSTTAIFFPLTFWMGTANILKVRATLEIVARGSTLDVVVGYQTADVENDPSSATALGSYLSTNGVHYPPAAANISSACEGAQLIRFGVLAKTSTGTDHNHAHVSGVVDLQVE